MARELHILILEDVPADAELIRYELAEAGIAFTSRLVATKGGFVKELEERTPDLILSDYSLPSFDGLSALKIVTAKYPEVPFIFVSGALGEERAIELLKKGATDYVLKDRLSRLGPAVSRALQEMEERNERIRAEQALRESEARYRTIFDNTGTATVIIDEDLGIALTNKQFEQLSGYTRGEIENKKSVRDFMLAEDLDKIRDFKWQQGKKFRKSVTGSEFRIVTRQEETKVVLASIAAIPSTERAVMSLLDITERKRAEDALRKRELELEMQTQSLEEANTALKVLLKHREEDKGTIEEQVLANVKRLVLPHVAELKHLNLDKNQAAHLAIIENHLQKIISPFLRNLSSSYLDLTPREIQIANLVKEGRTTKEITELLNISATAVDFHRKNLRAKFGIKNKTTNLRSYLASLSA